MHHLVLSVARAALFLLAAGGYVGLLTFVLVKVADATKRGNQ